MKKNTLHKNKICLTLGLLLISLFGFSQSPTIFNDPTQNGTTNTFTVPTGVTQITVEAWGGGGKGGSRTSGSSGYGGGGGGAYARKNITVIPGTTYTVNVGTGSTATVTTTASDSWFDTNTTVLAVGGLSVANNILTGAIGGLSSSCIGDVVYSGGNGANGSSGSYGGGGGSSAGTVTPFNGVTATNATGAIATLGGGGGNGGNGRSSSSGNGTAGSTAGGGGGGALRTSGSPTGGAGANGQVIITFTCPTANAGTPQTICTTTATLAGNTISGLTGTWTKISGSGSITSPTSPTSGVTGLSGETVFRWTFSNGRCGSTYDEVTITSSPIPSASITPTPANAATGICYGGTTPVTSVSWAATASATSYDVYFGAGSLPGSITANVTTNAYTTGTLLANTTYYWKVVAKNTCGDATGSSTWTFTTASTPCIAYCIPSTTSGIDGTGITNVSYSSVNNTTNNTLVYNDYTSFVGTAIQGATLTISVKTNTFEGDKDKTYYIKIWVDWNNDSDFDDTLEEVLSSTVKSNTVNGTITVPATASVGNHRIRIGISRKKDSNPLPIPCYNNNSIKAAYEDYTLNVVGSIACTSAPTVTTNPVDSSITINTNTSFSATFANSPSSYLWEVSSDGGANFIPITNGGVYTGATTNTLQITAATANMTGFKYRVWASNACGTSSISAVATLLINSSYCPASSSGNTYWIANFSSVGNLKDTSYSGAPLYATGGYGNYSSFPIATQVPGGGMNFSVITGTTVPDGGTQADRQAVACYVDWNGDGDFTDLGENVYTTGILGLLETTFGFVVPVSQGLGNYRLRIRSKKKDTTAIAVCTNYTTGETEDYSISVVQDCASKIQSVTNATICGTNTLTLGAEGLGAVTEYRWYTTETGGAPLATTVTGTWVTPIISATTTYYVTSFNGSCESLVRTPVVATVIPTTVINFNPAEPVACGEDSILTIDATGGNTVVELLVEDFEGLTTKFTTVTPTNTSGLATPWGVQSNTFQSPSQYWKPAISSGSIDTNCAFTTSDYAGANIVTQLTTTNSVNTTDFTTLTLTFRHYFSFYTGAANSAKVQVSTNGTTWIDVQPYTADLGSASKFKEETIILPNTYLNQPNLKFRFQYSGTFADGWAVDDIRLFGTKSLNTTFSWTSPPDTTVNAYTDLACTVPYNPISKVTTIHLKPDLSQLEAAVFPITITATLENGCPVSQPINVLNKTKVWRGGALTDWNNPSNWKPYGVPTAENCVIVPENTVISGTNYNAYAKNVVVKYNGTFELQPSNNLTVTDWIHVDTGGVFNIRNNASLVQINDVANTGIANIERITKPMFLLDYSYWNSPVTEASGFTLGDLSPLTSYYKWSYIPTIDNGSGNWQHETSSTVMTPTKGYIVRAPDTFSDNPATKTPFTATFVGTPNNGPILAPISKGNNADMDPGTIDDEDDEWNLIGNPYPSGIDAKKFLDLPANVPVLDGTIYIWTHNSPPSSATPDPFYGDFVLNYTSEDYASFNKTGATGTASSATTGGAAPSGFIATGQSFFVKSASVMANGTTANATFNNSMRATGNNSDFFKKAPVKTTTKEEKNRVWLNLTNNSGAFSQTLVGYVTGATQELDRGFDGESFGGNDVTFYSIIPQAQLTIQGRSLPFDTNDQVNLGYNAAIEGTFSIRIDHFDGIFSNQNIYLEDTELQTIHDLKEAPYTFTTAVGDYNNRFILRYSNTNKTLATNTFELSNSINVIVKEKVAVLSPNQAIKTIEVFDMLGRKIDAYKNVNETQFTLNHLNKTMAGLIVKITLDNDVIVSKKIIY